MSMLVPAEQQSQQARLAELLAAAIVPLALITLVRALKQRFDKHKRIARWTLPIWFYVSLTGVIIYWMLYQI